MLAAEDALRRPPTIAEAPTPRDNSSIARDLTITAPTVLAGDYGRKYVLDDEWDTSFVNGQWV